MSRASRHRQDWGTWRRDECLTSTWLPPFSIQEDDLKPFISPTRRNLSLLHDFFTTGKALYTPNRSSFNHQAWRLDLLSK